MNLINKSFLEIKKSKFYAYAYSIDNVSDVEKIINNLKNEYKKATHIVYAYKCLNTAGKNNDKEPSGTAADQLYNLIELNNLNNVLIVVIRFFGGTKLGAGLLARSYKNVANSALKH